MSQATAWVLPIVPGIDVAVGEFELVHILPDWPPLSELSGAPEYCREALIWQDQTLPLMDLAARFALPDAEPSAPGRGYIGIVAYRFEAGGEIGFGALRLAAIPWRCEVDDDQACDFPVWLRDFIPYASCCFQPEATRPAIPIVRLDLLFFGMGAVDPARIQTAFSLA